MATKLASELQPGDLIMLKVLRVSEGKADKLGLRLNVACEFESPHGLQFSSVVFRVRPDTRIQCTEGEASYRPTQESRNEQKGEEEMAVLTSDNWRTAVGDAVASLPDGIQVRVGKPREDENEMSVLITRPATFPGRAGQEIEIVLVRFWSEAREMYEADIAWARKTFEPESDWPGVADFIAWLRQRLAVEEQAGTALNPVVEVGFPNLEPPYGMTVGRASVESVESQLQLFVLESLHRDSDKTGVYKNDSGYYVRKDGTLYLPWQARVE
jgi:hypothetical protein